MLYPVDEKSCSVRGYDSEYNESSVSQSVFECIGVIQYTNKGSVNGNTFRGIAKATGISESQVRRICKPIKEEKKSLEWLLSVRKKYNSRLFSTNGNSNDRMWHDALHSHYVKLLDAKPEIQPDGTLAYICNTSRYDLLLTIGSMYGFEVKYIGEANNVLWVRYVGPEKTRNDNLYNFAFEEDYSDIVNFESNFEF